LTVASVEAVLDTVRNFLLADGGDVEVVSADDDTGIVELRFQGACASCAAQEATMSMGIERALRAAFGDRLKQVVAAEASGSGQATAPGTTKAAVDSLLQLLRPAVTNYGGSIDVVAVEGSICTVSYDGPEPIWVGVKAAIRDRFTDLRDVRRV
jgi:NFU1 iron-sulfur cluster scaffold homolog, mitochondrial